MIRTTARLTAALVVAAALSGTPAATAAGPCLVGSGYDLFQTRPGTQFDLLTAVDHLLPGVLPPDMQSGTVVGFSGVPLGQYDFAGVGTFPTASTDTIVRRLSEATPTQPVVQIELVALQLQATNLGGFLNTDLPLFVTLQSQRGRNALDPAPGPRSTGSLVIQFRPDCSGGTLSSSINVYFDLRIGSVDGPIVSSSPTNLTQVSDPTGMTHLSLSSIGTPWDRIGDVQHRVDEYEQAGMTWHKVVGPPVLIERVNHNLPEGDFQAGSIN